MDYVAKFLIAVVQLLIVLGASPVLVSLIRRLKARLQGRLGPPWFQPYYDLAKYFQKESVVSETASWIFNFTPYLQFVCMLLIALFVPFYTAMLPLDATGGIIVIMYFFLLSTFFLALSGLDTGSAFGGMGSSREMTIAALAEPTIILAVFSISLVANSTNISTIILRLGSDYGLLFNPTHLLAFAAFVIVTIAETGRLPVDNPTTHLELTMIHEAMILEYSGRHLALVEWSAWMKLFLFLSLLTNLFFPWGVATSLDLLSFVAGLVIFAVKLTLAAGAIAFMETILAKVRIFRVPELLAGSFAIALLAIISFYVL
ncbi:MAG: formate hydrogenlyase [Chloroflexi bacterium]|nr:formate hydrogenlyase [Chloroflexota bacterium]